MTAKMIFNLADPQEAKGFLRAVKALEITLAIQEMLDMENKIYTKCKNVSEEDGATHVFCEMRKILESKDLQINKLL